MILPHKTVLMIGNATAQAEKIPKANFAVTQGMLAINGRYD
jgi:hypothetical protein